MAAETEAHATWTPHECDGRHEGRCSECCRLAGPCTGCLPCDECRKGLAHMWHVLSGLADQWWAEVERKALLAISQAAHR